MTETEAAESDVNIDAICRELHAEYCDALRPLAEAIAHLMANPGTESVVRLEDVLYTAAISPWFDVAPRVASHYHEHAMNWGDEPWHAWIANMKRKGVLDAVVSDGERWLSRPPQHQAKPESKQ